MTIKETLRQAMDRHKINIPELARRCSLNQQTLYNFFSGNSNLTSANLERIMGVLGLTISDESDNPG